MRDELLSGPNPLAELNPAAVGGLVFEAHQAQLESPDTVNLLRNDIAPHIDDLARAAGLMVWLRLDLEAIGPAEDHPEAYANVIGLWNEYARLSQKGVHIKDSAGYTLDGLLARRLWKGFCLAEGSAGKRDLDQASLQHLWDLSELANSAFAFEQNEVSVVQVFNLMAEACGEQTDSAFQHASQAFLRDMMESGLLNQRQIEASAIHSHHRDAVHPQPSLTASENHLVVFFRSLILACISVQRYSEALEALLALLQNLATWDRLDQASHHQRLLPDQQPLVSHLMLRAIASEQTPMVEHVGAMLTRLASIPNAFNSATNRQLLHAYLDLALSSHQVASNHQLKKAIDILECLAPGFTGEMPLMNIIAVLPPRLVIQLLMACRDAGLSMPEKPTEDRLRYHTLYKNLSFTLTHLITESASSTRDGSVPWARAHQRMALQIFCGPCLDPNDMAHSAVALYQHLRITTPAHKTLTISPSELLQLARYATSSVIPVEDPHKFGHQLVSDFFAARSSDQSEINTSLDHIDLTALAAACYRLGFTTAGSNIYYRMLEDGIIPSWQDINIILGQLSKEDPAMAKSALLALRDAGFRPDASTYVSIAAPHQSWELFNWATRSYRSDLNKANAKGRGGQSSKSTSPWIEMSARLFRQASAISLTKRVRLLEQLQDPRPAHIRSLAGDVLRTRQPELILTVYQAAAKASLLHAAFTLQVATAVYTLSKRNEEHLRHRMAVIFQALEDYPRIKAELGANSVEQLQDIAADAATKSQESRQQNFDHPSGP